MHLFFQAEDGIRDYKVTGVQTCALPILNCSSSGQNATTATCRGRLRCVGNPLSLRLDGRATNSGVVSSSPAAVDRKSVVREREQSTGDGGTVYRNTRDENTRRQGET